MKINTNGATQSKQLLEYLLIQTTVTTTYCRDRMSIMHPAGRITELRKQGWPIGLGWYQQVDASGAKHKAGEYYMRMHQLTFDQRRLHSELLIRRMSERLILKTSRQ